LFLIVYVCESHLICDWVFLASMSAILFL